MKRLETGGPDGSGANGFGHVDEWIFDLDNTLYPPECNLFQQIDQRMGEFISDLLNIDRVEARRIQKNYFKEYGTTLKGLMSEHNLAPERFLDYVHDIDHSPVQANPLLDVALAALPGRKLVFTNGSLAHAQKVLERLGISRHFSVLHDIAACRYEPKPHKNAYDSLIRQADIDPSRAAMFEDISRNLTVPHEMGMVTIFVRAKSFHPDSELDILGTGREEHVHHVTDDLTGFLGLISRGGAGI